MHANGINGSPRATFEELTRGVRKTRPYEKYCYVARCLTLCVEHLQNDAQKELSKGSHDGMGQLTHVHPGSQTAKLICASTCGIILPPNSRATAASGEAIRTNIIAIGDLGRDASRKDRGGGEKEREKETTVCILDSLPCPCLTVATLNYRHSRHLGKAHTDCTC